MPQFSLDDLKPGVVLKAFVKDTTPPKYKYLIVVGRSDESLCIATVFVNSNINKNVFREAHLQRMHVSILPTDLSSLSYESFVDCTSIEVRDSGDLVKRLNEGKSARVDGAVKESKFLEIMSALRESKTISRRDKRAYGIL